MRVHTINEPTIRRGRFAAVLVAALLLTACGGDDAGSPASADDDQDLPETAEELSEDADELADDVDDIAEGAQQQLDDAGVDTDSSDAYAEVQFQGETLRIPADESFGCFITEDGGSDGAVDFTGTDDAGNEISLGWSGDTPETSSLLSLTLADGSEWYQADTDFDVTISGATSAVVAATLSGFDGTDTQEADIVVRAVCN